MMKIIKPVLVVSILCLFFSQSAMAYTANNSTSESYPSAAGEKLVSGLANVVTGVGEIPKSLIIYTRDNGVGYGMTVGLAAAIMHTLGRTVFGALDVVTFMFPTGPSVSPSFIWNDFSTETAYISN
jgi:putative exosortase-associated protein (TIGR04073 family)